MKRILWAILAISLSCCAWSEQDYRYSALEDWARIGYVHDFKDESDTSVSVVADCNSSFWKKTTVAMLARANLVVDKQQEFDGNCQITTDWKSVPVNGFASFMSGIDAARTRFVLTSQPVGSWSKVEVQAQLEIASDGGTWRQSSDRELRNAARQLLVLSLARPIYGDTDSIRVVLQEHTQDGKPLPTREEFCKRFGTWPRSLEISPPPAQAPIIESLPGMK